VPQQGPICSAWRAANAGVPGGWRRTDGMQRLVIGATLTILGVLILLFAPAPGEAVGCDGGCHNYGSTSLTGLIHWPPGWYTLFLPMSIIGVALVVTGIVLLIKHRRSGGSPGTAR
jgi:uncharacterized membrane protein